MAERYEMSPLSPNVIALLPAVAEYEGKAIPTAEVETTVPAETRGDVSVVIEGRPVFPWRGQAVRIYDETGKLIDWIT